MASAVYLLDTSVFVLQGRLPSVRRRFENLLAAGRAAACQMTALEYLNNAPSPQAYERLRSALGGMRWLDVTAGAMDRALETHGHLAAISRNRGFALPDLVIAATAETHGVSVLHYDTDYDRIAGVTGQPVEWVVPRGSL
jgi:predicted nucleic acid-binding protein